MDAWLLRYDDQLRGPNVFRGVRRPRSPIIDLLFVVRFGDAQQRVLNVTACVYGRQIPERRERVGLPFSLARGGSTTWHLESCKLHSDIPRTSFLLINVPLEVGDDWSADGSKDPQ